jgi:hypothetical protein
MAVAVYGRLRRLRQTHRDPEVRQVAGEFHARFGKRLQRVRGIAYPVHACRKAERGDWLNQEFLQLCGSLVVAPIADPAEIKLPRDLRPRPKNSKVRGLVPSESVPCPAPSDIGIAQDLPERQHPIETVEMHGRHRSRRAHDAVVRVMEPQQIRTAGLPVRGDSGDKLRLVPLVHQNEIRTVQYPIEIEPCRVIDTNGSG